jgi:glutamate--cysteine ligase
MTFISNYLTEKLHKKQSSIIEWIASKIPQKHKLIYSSIDIRNSGYKIVPIDANLFPAGFNNLSLESIDQAQQELAKFCKDSDHPKDEAIIIAESHTRNTFYLDSLINLEKILSGYFATTTYAHLGDEDLEAKTFSGEIIMLKALKSLEISKQLVILNNDLTDGTTKLLESISELVIPPIKLGWHQRKKTSFFEIYHKIVNEFAKEFQIDEFYLTSLVKNCSNINFKTSTGIDCIATNTEKTLHLLRDKYKQHDIKLEPYVIIKSNSGTYGMSVMAAKSGEDIYQMNKKRRNKMSAGKGGIITNEVMIQEGIETIEKYQDLTAETMAYSVAAKPVSLIYRTHENKDSKSNLNSPGMRFSEIKNGQIKSKYWCHNLVTHLSNLALIQEIETFKN